jgi:TRAP-type C4-dicarboxylate transport system permease small subunit
MLDTNLAPRSEPGKLVRLPLWICRFVLVGMVILTVAEVSSRSLLHVSLQVTDEIGGYLVVALTFLSLSAAYQSGAFHSMEILLGRLSPARRELLVLVFNAASLACCVLVTWQLARFTWRTFSSGEASNTLLSTPLWLPQAIMPIGMLALCVALIQSLVAGIRALRRSH